MPSREEGLSPISWGHSTNSLLPVSAVPFQLPGLDWSCLDGDDCPGSHVSPGTH